MISESDNTPKWDVFVSYAREDRSSAARELVHALRCSGLSVWYDEIDSHLKEEDLSDHSNIESELMNISMGARVCIALISKSYLSKPWPLKELMYMVSASVGDFKDRILIPISIDADDQYIKERIGSIIFREITKKVEIIKWPEPDLVEIIKQTFPPRSLLRQLFYNPPGQLAVFEEMGMIVIGHEGGLFSTDGQSGEVDILDFRGNSLVKGKIQNVFNTLIEGLDGEIEFSSRNISEFNMETRCWLINHINQEIFSKTQVENGSVMNFGTNEDPIIYYPFFTNGSVTLGVVSVDMSERISALLEIAKNSYEGIWRRIIIDEDRFYVV